MSSGSNDDEGPTDAPVESRRRRAWSSLSARLAVWYVVVTVVSFVVAAAVFTVRMRASLEDAESKSAEGLLERYRQALESGGTTALKSMFDCGPSPAPRLALRLTDERDVELFGLSSDDDSRRAAATTGTEAEGASHSPAWKVVRTSVSERRILSIAVHDEQSAALWHRLRETSFAIFGVGLVLAVLGGMWITQRTLRPVTALVEATHKIVQSGNLGLRVETRASTDELAQLTHLFNRMLSKNQDLVKAMRESLDYVAHDLRTPLTRLRAGAELALRAAPDAGKERDALAEVIEESDRMLVMLTTLTDIVEAEAGAMRLDRKLTDLGQIVREAVELYEFVAKERGIVLVTHLASDVKISMDGRRISQVCANLIDNALKYSLPGGRVEVAVFRDDRWATLRISDTGIGIAPSDRNRVWERLFRADRSRGEHGLGLGLGLVKAVVEAHGGDVRLESELGVGSTFEVRLPHANA